MVGFGLPSIDRVSQLVVGAGVSATLSIFENVQTDRVLYSGNLINTDWFMIHQSRGLDDHDLKVFMRATVIVSEYLIFIPAATICVRHLGRLAGISTWESSIALTAILMQPATLLIDHGHFQYNTVMLGFVVASISSMLGGQPLWGCVYFVAALGFKQMALFYAPAVFAYLLGICLFPRINIVRFLGIALVTVASFAVLFLPILLGGLYDAHRNIPLPSTVELPPLLSSLPFHVSEKAWYYPMLLQLTQAIHRIFPFARGLFEDKVANIWCAIHTSGIHKLYQYDSALLSRAALGLTSLSILPACIIIFLMPRRNILPWAFASVSWGFFLCSYQVHEKNVLLPLLPMTLLLASEGGLKADMRAWIGFANILGSWTLYPLLKKDELRIPYFVLTLLWAYLMGLPPVSTSTYFGAQSGEISAATKLLHMVFYLGMVAWHVAEAFIPPPASKPDLWVVGNVCLGTAGFGICYLWCSWNLLAKSRLLAWGKKVPKPEEKKL